jgi:hypothetical protein
MTEMGMVLPDIPRVYTALAEWLSCMILIFYMKRREHGWRLILFCVTALVVQTLALVYTPGLKGIWWIACMLAAIFLMMLFLYHTCDIEWRNAVYYGAFAFMMAETAASLEWQLYLYCNSIFTYTGLWLEWGVLILVYSVIYVVFWRMNKLLLPKGEKGQKVDVRELWEALLITTGVFFTSNLGFVAVNTPFSGMYSREIFNIRTFADVAGLAILYAFHVQWRDQRVRGELKSIQIILENQYTQYKQSQKSLDLINYKYHDLKHHIIALRAEEDRDRRNAYLDKMEQEIMNYEVQFKTGNKVLDTLLMSKGLYCQQHDISFTCVVDGTQFDFIDVMDICSIFGNALDNAIECEKRIPDKEKRMIHVSAFSEKNFLIIRFENYYEGTLQFEKNFPVTTKRDSEFHGYGLKSLQYTVHKYNGETDVVGENNWFRLRILIPL